jgi:hypothetical protein
VVLIGRAEDPAKASQVPTTPRLDYDQVDLLQEVGTRLRIEGQIIMYTTQESRSCEHVVKLARLSQYVVPTNGFEVRAVSLVISCQGILRQNLPRATSRVADRSRIAVFGNFSCRPVDFTESVSFYQH